MSKDEKVSASAVAAAAASGVAVVGAVAKVDWAPELCLGSLPETQRGYGQPIYYSPHLGGVVTYGSGNLAFIRNVKNPAICDTFTSNEHKGRITVVQVAPNGEWIASGDDKGIVLVWGSRPGQHIIKLKVEVNKRVWDLCWSFDSSRIVAVGDGAESKAKVFDWASGNNFGTIDGHANRILSCAFKPSRPFRIVTSGEDLAVNFYEGPPFKWSTGNTKATNGHDRYPNCVRYSPSGNHYISVGADSKIFVYDGKDGKVVKKIEHKDNHKATITSVAWNGDGSKFVTASMDKTVKQWSFDAKTGDAQVTHTYTFSKKPVVSDMQVGVVYAEDTPISLSLSGALNYLDEKAPDAPKRVVMGHQKAVRGFAVDRKNGVVFTTDDDGALAKWNISTGEASWFTGCPRANDSGKALAAAAVTADGSKVVTVGLDDKYRFHDVKSGVFNVNGGALGGEPTGVAAASKDNNLAAVTLSQEKVVLIREASVLATTPVGFKPNCVAFSHDDKQIAVGGQDAKVRVYNVAADGKLTLSKTLEGHTARVTAITYSPDGRLLASCDANRQILLWKDGEQQNPTGWTFHNAAPADLSFPSDSGRIVSAAADQDIIVWSDLKGYEHQFQRIGLAHPSGVEHVSFVDDNKLISSGADRCIRTWTYKKPASA